LKIGIEHPILFVLFSFVIENCRERMRFVDMIIDPKVEVIELIYQLFVIDVAS